MQETFGNQEFGNLDLKDVPAIHQKRTLAFVNHFLFTTVQFLNNFLKTCEQKLMDFERKIEKVEASMVLLEARLSSIPESNMVTVPLMLTQDVPIENKQTDIQGTEIDYQKQEETDSIDIPVRPEYDRFVKMVNVGVPLAAAKLKASLEGLDPNVLETLLKK